MSFEKNASPLLRKIVIDIAPDAAAAECPCEALSERKAAIIRLRVARELFGRNFRDSRALGAFLDAGDYAASSLKKYRLSQELLPLDGIGDDSFFLNEDFGDEGPRLSGFTTLRSWDEHTHHRQEGYAAEEGHREAGEHPYIGCLLWDWARWLEKGSLVYGNLSVASSYLGAQLEEHGAEIARNRYQTTWVEGPEHGSKTPDGHYTWNMIETPPANSVLRSSAERLAHLAVTAWVEGPLSQRIAETGVWVRRKRMEEDGEITEEVVFSGVEAMDRARFRNWLEDLSSLPDGSAVYDGIEAAAKERLTTFMEHVFAALEHSAAQIGDVGRDDRNELFDRALEVLKSYPGIGF